MRGKELFAIHAMQWQAGFSTEGQPVDAAIAAGKTQILADVRRGRVPKSVKSFSELHDYVDANYYGNGFDWPVLPSETEDDAYQQAFADFWNRVQDTLSEWVSSGQMLKELSQWQAGNERG